MHSSLFEQFHHTLAHTGLVAILRGIQPNEVQAVADVLYEAGFRLIEIPLNSPDPLTSIETLVRHLPQDALVGAGTVLSVQQVQALVGVGGTLQVMPHADPDIIRAGVQSGLVVLPGVSTPTEAFAALAAGATGLKLFPAELLQPPVLKAWRAVLPAGVPLLPVGGITPQSLPPYCLAGASGFGLGGALYRAGDTPAEVTQRAARFMAAWKAQRGSQS